MISLIAFYIPLVFPLIVGVIILKFNKSDELTSLIGFLTLKPAVTFPIWFVIYFILSLVFPEGVNYSIQTNYSINIPIASVAAIAPGVILTFCLFIIFKRVFRTTKAAWLFLIGDIIRWSYTWVLSITLPEHLDTFACVGFIIPSIYAVAAIAFLESRSKKSSIDEILQELENADQTSRRLIR